MRLFAISDLHLSFGTDKPMDVFGPQWEGHADKLRTAWDSRIGPSDWVLVGGDTSWGLTLKQAQPDLDWLGARPGQKILIKGNHCTWWTSLAKVKAALHPSIHPLQHDAMRLDERTVVLGARLWDPPGSPWSGPETEKIYRREVERLKLAIEAVRKLGEGRRIALVHYPPRYTDQRTTEFAPLLEEAGVSICVYGHLHGKDHRSGFQGDANGIRYYLASCDAVDFSPFEIPLDG